MKRILEKLQKEVSEFCQALEVKDIYGYGVILISLLGLLTSVRISQGIFQIGLDIRCTFLILLSKYLASVLFFSLAWLIIFLLDGISEDIKENPNFLKQVLFLLFYFVLLTFTYFCFVFLGFDGIFLLGLSYLLTKVKKNFVNRE